MAQTSGKVGQTSEVAISDHINAKPGVLHRLQRFVHYVSSNWMLCILVAAVALAFDLNRLGTPSIWFDEAFSSGGQSRTWNCITCFFTSG
jgi:hypothetical protein